MRELVVASVASVAFVPALHAQGKFPPDSFTNLKVLPKTIGKEELLATMRSFALGLGVRCTYCHVGREGAPLDSVKFASDDKRTKRAARVMMDMVKHINGEHLADVPERPEPHVGVRYDPGVSELPGGARQGFDHGTGAHADQAVDRRWVKATVDASDLR